MEKRNAKYAAYVQTLKEELVPAMGCTEPIAPCLWSCQGQRGAGGNADRVVVGASGSIIKNVKSVIVPNTDHLKGIPAAAAAGIVAGDADKELEVIASVSSEQTAQMKEFMEQVPITVEHIDNGITFDIVITLYKGVSYARVRIANYHTNIVLVEKNGEILEKKPVAGESEDGLTDRSLLNMKDILDFARTVDIEDVREVLERQIDYNWAIAEEGIRGNYGANIGSVLLDMEGESVRVRAKAMAAAGSDARMNGCELPVIINSGSGNQGITASVPVIVYAKDMKVSLKTPAAGADPSNPDGHPPENSHRKAFCLLRCCQCGSGSRGRNRLSSWRRLQRNRTYGGKCPCHCVRNCLRRSEGFLRGKDCFCGRCRHFGISDVYSRPAVFTAVTALSQRE